MDVTATRGPETRSGPAHQLTQYTVGQTLAVWAAAALPMGILAWVIAPRLATVLGGPFAQVEALLVLLAIGLVWQFVLVMWLIWREQGSLRWVVLRHALWLRSPKSPRTGRAGGRVWLVLIPLGILFFVETFLPTLPVPSSRDFGAFIGSPAGEAFFHGSWGWFGLLIVMWIFNTVLGEELLFRGLLLPRMNGAFGKADWLANGVLFATYHLHMPWAIPSILADSLTLAYPSKRYQSAWVGMAVHSLQSVFLCVIVLGLVL